MVQHVAVLLVLLVSLACPGTVRADCGSAALHANSCIHDGSGRIGPLPTLTAKDAAACCAACGDNRKCKAWTFYGENSCNLFADAVKTGRAGDCVSSVPAGGPSPSPPSPHSPWVPPPPFGPPCTDCPNIIFSLTDDQDIKLDGWAPMVQTQQLLQARGAELTQWRIHTPICCPSRSEAISGRYFHNIKSSLAVPPTKVHAAANAHVNSSRYENATFGTFLRQQRGYQTGIFGKSDFKTMEGFDRWFEGAYLGYGGTWQDNESPDFKYKASADEYATSLLGNKSIEWLSRENVTGNENNGRPFFLYFAPHCPHIPSTPAKWYENECVNVTSPRSPNYNWSTPLFHELISGQPPLSDHEADLIDDLARLRCQCLMSVDDAHAALYQKLVDLGVENNTYWFVTSDHGYNLGQHRLPSNKFLPYEHSTRIPMVVKGPGVPAGSSLPFLGTNVDLAPTWLALADVETPRVMDGRPFAASVVTNMSDAVPAATRRFLQRHPQPTEREEQFFEYYNQGPWRPNDDLDGLNRTLDDYSNSYIGLYVSNASAHAGGHGNLKYVEYEYVCTSEQIAANRCFQKPDFYELFALDTDPYELHNIYNGSSPNLRQSLSTLLQSYYRCQGVACA